MTFEEFKNTLRNAETEEVVKAAYASYFKIKYDTSHHHDLYTEQVFFEFKADRNLKTLLDRLTDESQRRFEGEFYTPLRFGQKAVLYFTKVLGKNWYKTGKYRIWDMAAGTGNLEYHLPAEAYKYLYMSTLHAVRKIPKPTWLNDRNQFLIPHTDPSKEFTTDCVVWSLFALSNETTALKDVKYLGETYQIKNNFYPFRLEEIKRWEIKDPDFRRQIVSGQERFVATWLSKNKLSDEAKEVVRKAKAVYKLFYANLNKMTTGKWKIGGWDAGWYQIRRCLTEHNLAADALKELGKANERLADKILPRIEEYGFLDRDEVYAEI